jgi:hypothetical protein
MTYQIPLIALAWGFLVCVSRRAVLCVFGLLAALSLPHYGVAAPQLTSLQQLMKDRSVQLTPDGVTFEVGLGIEARDPFTGLSVRNLSELLSVLSMAKVDLSGQSSSTGLLLQTDAPEKGSLRIQPDGLIVGSLPGTEQWANLYKVEPRAVQWLVEQVGKPQMLAVSEGASGGGSTVMISGALSREFTIQFAQPGVSQDETSSAQSSGVVIFRPASYQGTAAGSDPAGATFLNGGAGEPNQYGGLEDGSTDSGGSFGLDSTAPFGSTAPSGGAAQGNTYALPGGLTQVGSGPSAPGVGSGPDDIGGKADFCAKIVLGRPVDPRVAAGNPNRADAEAEYIPFEYGSVRIAESTASVTIGDVTVGQVSPSAIASDAPQTILAGLNYVIREAIGYLGPQNTATSWSSSTSPSAESSGGELIIAGISYPHEAHGLGGFQWTPKQQSDGTTSVLVESPGSASNALLLFGQRNKVGYAPIKEIRLAGGVTITYSNSSPWDAAIEYRDPLMGSVVKRYAKQPSEDKKKVVVLSSIQVGDTTFEQGSYTFTDMGGELFVLSTYRDLTNGTEFNYSYGSQGSLPAQWSSEQHTQYDKSFAQVLPSFDRVTGSVDIALKRHYGERQQHPGSPPWFSIPAHEVTVGGRQYLTDTQHLKKQLEQGGDSAQRTFTTAFLDVTNPKSTVRQYPQTWSSSPHSRATAHIQDGVRVEQQRNSVGAITSLSQVFANNRRWTSTWEREAYWPRVWASYSGEQVIVEGSLLHPTTITSKDSFGTSITRLQWQEYERSGWPSQKLLTQISQQRSGSNVVLASLAWNDDRLARFTDADGFTTEITPTTIRTLSAQGKDMFTVLLEQSFTSSKTSFPDGFNLQTSLSSGVFSSVATFRDALLNKTESSFGKGATKSGAASLQSSTGTTTTAGGQHLTALTRQANSTSSSTQGPTGSSLSQSTQATHSLTKSAPSCTQNGVTAVPGACTLPFTSASHKSTEWDEPSLAISSADVFKKDGKYYVAIGYSNTVSTPAKALVLQSKGAPRPEEFATEPNNQCDRLQLHLLEFQKIATLNCEFQTTRGDIDQNGTITPPMPPVYISCEISPEDACGGMEIMLAAGIPNGNQTPAMRPNTPYHQGPAFASRGFINGFSGYVSNRFKVRANSELCTGSIWG